ncbi:restriction endonuclease subunit S [Bacillus alkalisoli]|uniref:restriction endonuclease subunit S n=1 Tax=Bacillus alkalisoli TaxID=2011008 RepID=UPI000C2345AD|nr:restriction endonuclease subunit S [Bacillus alkalisoli]
MQTPKLRFSGFECEWKTKKLHEIGQFKNGINKSKEDFGHGNSFVNLNDVFGKTSIKNSNFGLVKVNKKDLVEYNLKKGDVLFIRSSVKPSGVGLTSVVLEDLIETTFSGFLIRFRDTEINLDIKFKEFCFSTPSFRKKLLAKSTISANTNINQESLKSLSINIPFKEEQRKIGEFFSLINKNILLQQEKIELLKEQKKGYTQKIFSQEKRFKDKDGLEFPKWSRQKLGNFTERVTRKNSDLKTKRPLTISAQHGLIDQVEFFNKTVASQNLTGYYLLQKGEYAYNKSYSNGYPLGAIKRLNNYENGALSTLYICFKTNENVNSDFLVHYFDSTQWHKEVSLICVEGARNHGLLNVSVSEFFETLHYLPCLEEQLIIAKFFDSINKQIKLNELTLKNLQKQKKAYMQQMFI